MGVPASDVGYTSVTTGRGDHEVHKEHVVALEEEMYSNALSLKYVGNRPLNSTNINTGSCY
jgi:hypothetical protein